MFSPTAVATPPSAGNTMTASSVNRDKMDRTDLALMSYLELPQFSAKEMVQMAPYLEKTDPSQPTSTANMVRRIKFSALQAKADERRRVEAAMALGTGNGDVGTADESIAPDLRALRLIISGSSASNAASPASALAEGGLEDDNDSAKGSGGSRKRRARASLAGSNAKLRFSTGSLTGGDPASPSVSSDDFAGLSSSAGLAGTLAVAAASASAITSSAPEDKPKTHVNHDHCESCRGTGVLICCDTCPLSYHYFCTDPPLDPERLPEGDWHCVKCQTQRNKVVMPNRARSEAGTILRLIDVANTSNPTTYALPKALQNYFEGVGADAITGAYVDKVMRRTVMDPSLVNQLSDGARCHGCGKAASDSVSAIECSFCPLVWHHDCMDPPMVQAPPLHHKWICPVHAEALLPRKRIRRRGRAALYILRPQLPPSYYAAAAAAAANVEDGSEDECNGEVVDLASSLIPTEAAHIAIELESSRPPGRHVVAEQAIKLDFVRGSTRRADEEQVVHDVVLVRVPDEVVECYASARKPVHTDERDVAAFLESIVKLQEDAAAQVVRSQRQARETLLDELLSEDTRIGRLFGQLPLPDLKRLAKGEPVSEIAQDMMRQAPPTAELYRDEPLLLRFAAWNWYQSAKEQVRLTRTAAAALT